MTKKPLDMLALHILTEELRKVPDYWLQSSFAKTKEFHQMFLPLFFPDGKVRLKGMWPLYPTYMQPDDGKIEFTFFKLIVQQTFLNGSVEHKEAGTSHHASRLRGYSSRSTSKTNSLPVWTGLVERQQLCGCRCSLVTPTLMKRRPCPAFGIFRLLE